MLKDLFGEEPPPETRACPTADNVFSLSRVARAEHVNLTSAMSCVCVRVCLVHVFVGSGTVGIARL